MIEGSAERSKSDGGIMGRREMSRAGLLGPGRGWDGKGEEK